MLQKIKASGIFSSTLLILGMCFLMQCALGFVGKGAVRVPHSLNKGLVKAGDTIRFQIATQNLTPLPISVFSEAGCSCSVVENSAAIFTPFGHYTSIVEVNTSNMKPGIQHKPAKIKFQYSNRSWEEIIDLAFQIQ